jgi:hypothetical protein
VSAPDEDERSFHEAGHAVAAAVLGTPIKRASLGGVTTWVRVGCPRARRNEAIIALSGPAAEDLHRRHTAPEREQMWRTAWAADWANALRQLAGGDPEAALRRAQRLVCESWGPIERLARALRERGELAGAEVDAVIGLRRS